MPAGYTECEHVPLSYRDQGAIRPLPKDDLCTADDYWSLPDGVRAELIDGDLWDLASPSRMHQRIVSMLTTRLSNHIEDRGGTCEVYPAPFAVNLFADDSTFVEPDVSVICDHDKLSDRGCEGAPDFVAEVVSPSNPGMDYLTKLNLYRMAGVREYWICDPLQERVMVYVFDSASVVQVYGFSTPVPSTIFPGFEFDFGRVVGN